MAFLYRTELQDFDMCCDHALKAIRQSPTLRGPPTVSSSTVYALTLRSEVCSCGLHSKDHRHFKEGLFFCEDLLGRVQSALSQGRVFGNVQEMLELLMKTANTLHLYGSQKRNNQICDAESGVCAN
eukprot:gene23877-9449_t